MTAIVGGAVFTRSIAATVVAARSRDAATVDAVATQRRKACRANAFGAEEANRPGGEALWYCSRGPRPRSTTGLTIGRVGRLLSWVTLTHASLPGP